LQRKRDMAGTHPRFKKTTSSCRCGAFNQDWPPQSTTPAQLSRQAFKVPNQGPTSTDTAADACSIYLKKEPINEKISRGPGTYRHARWRLMRRACAIIDVHLRHARCRHCQSQRPQHAHRGGQARQQQAGLSRRRRPGQRPESPVPARDPLRARYRHHRKQLPAAVPGPVAGGPARRLRHGASRPRPDCLPGNQHRPATPATRSARPATRSTASPTPCSTTRR